MKSLAQRRLADWMKEHGHTQERLAKVLGTSQSNVSSWLRISRPSLEWMMAIREETGIAVEDWATDESGEMPAARTGTGG